MKANAVRPHGAIVIKKEKQKYTDSNSEVKNHLAFIVSDAVRSSASQKRFRRGDRMAQAVKTAAYPDIAWGCIRFPA